MKKIFINFLIILFLFSCDQMNNDPNVKKSKSGICHKKGTQYYKQTKNYKSFNSINDCLNDGGRLPR